MNFSVFAALCWSSWWLRLLLHLRLAFFLLLLLLLIIVLEEKKGKHAEDTADADTNGFALHRGKQNTKTKYKVQFYSSVVSSKISLLHLTF